MSAEASPDGILEAPGAAAGRLGPLLYLRGMHNGRVLLTALVVDDPADAEKMLVTDREQVGAASTRLRDNGRILLYRFSLPARADAWYAFDDECYRVNAAFAGDLRIAYVSCNGQEHGDLERRRTERNAMWRRLARQHSERPFNLLLHGGDQIYADEIADAHPAVRRWARGATTGGDDVTGGDEEVAEALRRAFLERYLEVLGQPEIAGLMARVPSLAMWDDHDICDGWGSLPASRLDAPVGRALFAAAREHFLLFQLGAPAEVPPEICADRTGTSLGWHLALPGLHLIAPDLRSERRRERVMGPHGWEMLDRVLERARDGRVLLMSSVPALGPRLSWVEALMRITPRMEKYEDDLRDQWQSRTHRAEWRQFLERLTRVHARSETPVTLISGEIHLATCATLDVPPQPMHQLVASGIAHSPPPWLYARTLGALARLGESPLPGHPIRLHPLPGKKAIYTAERNYLVIERLAGAWRAWWELEETGTTPALDL